MCRPLRDRPEDIPLLVNYFLKKFAQPKSAPPNPLRPMAVALLESFHWPGNVRELENVIQRATVMAKGDVILPCDLPAEIAAVAAPAPAVGGAAFAAPVGRHERGDCGLDKPGADPCFIGRVSRVKLKVLPAVERELIIQALLETKGNQVQAAKLLGITRATLRKRVDKFGIKQELAIK